MTNPSRPYGRTPWILFAVSLFALPITVSALEGDVRGPNGEGIADITVGAHLHGNVRHETVTDSMGTFQFHNLTVDEEAIMQLDGPDGTGRVVVTEAMAEEPLALEYPVISEVILLHDNDQHFDFNFAEAIQAEIERIRDENPNVFHLNAGDIFTRHSDRWGEPEDVEWYAEQAFSMIDTMNQVGYDALAAGNHELDHHGDYTRQALERAEFPLLCANMTITTDRLPEFEPYTVFDTREGYTIAVLGLSVGDFEGVTPMDPIETTKEYVHLAEEHDLFLAATHIGYNTDRELAAAVPELDVIIGGHSHTLLEEPEMVNGVLVAQAGGGGHEPNPEKPMYLGRITLTLENGTPIQKTGFVREFTQEDQEAAEKLAFEKVLPAG